MRYYKVTNHWKQSCTAEGTARVQYTTDDFVEAPTYLQNVGYHLLVFDSLKNAKYFSATCFFDQGLRIWSVKAECIVRMPNYLRTTTFENANFCPPTELYNYGTWPPGTVMVKRLKLLREVIA